MSHPLDEVQHTPWGRRVDDDLRLLKTQIKEIDGKWGLMHIELKANTVKTDAVHKDTQEIVTLFKASQIVWKILVSMSLVLGGIATLGIWLGWLSPHLK